MERRTQEPRQSEEVRKNRQMVQIFVKVDGSKTLPLVVSPSDKVDDIMRRILNNVKSSKSDVYMTCEGRVLRWSDELRSSGVGDGCTVQIMSMLRGGGKHRNKKNTAEKKQPPVRKEPRTSVVQGQQGPKNDMSLLSCESIVERHGTEDKSLRR